MSRCCSPNAVPLPAARSLRSTWNSATADFQTTCIDTRVYPLVLEPGRFSPPLVCHTYERNK